MADRPAGLAARFADAWNARDAAALGALFVEDARFVNVMGTLWRSRREIEEGHAFAFRTTFRDAAIELLSDEEFRIADGVVAVQARWRMTGHRVPSGKIGAPREGLIAIVGRREADGWRIALFHNTEADPAAEARMRAGQAAEARGA